MRGRAPLLVGDGGVPISRSAESVGSRKECQYARATADKVLGFVLKKNSFTTELDEFRENSDEFRTQFGEFSECET
jgi:hypothetical protein